MADQSILRELNVLVMNPEHIIFEGKAKAITGKNNKGTFDVLPFHTNFVSLIKEKVTILDMNNGKHEVPIEEAIMKVYKNTVWIFMGIKESAIPTILRSTMPPVPAQGAANVGTT